MYLRVVARRFSPRFLVVFLICTALLPLADVSLLIRSEAQGQIQHVGHPRPNLTLTTHIVEQRYCSDGGILFTLKSEYKNTGDTDLIVFRYALPACRYTVSKTVKAALAKRYEQVMSPMMGSGPSHVQWGNEPPTDYFVVLKPQQSYVPVNTIKEILSLAESDKPGAKQYLASGEHVLQLHVATWPLEENLAGEFRNRWQAFGDLWTDSVLSLPLTFRIDDSRQRLLSDCNAPFKLPN